MYIETKSIGVGSRNSRCLLDPAS